MTKAEFEALPEGAKVWYEPMYFAFPVLGVVKVVDGVKGVYVNLFGDGQCQFSPSPTWEELFYAAVEVAGEEA